MIPDTTWGYLLAAYAVLIAVKEGMQGIGGLACSRPIMVLLVNALAAIVFSFVLIILALMMYVDEPLPLQPLEGEGRGGGEWAFQLKMQQCIPPEGQCSGRTFILRMKINILKKC